MRRFFSKFIKNTVKKRGGFSLAEVIVSLAVISIVCAATISFVSAQTRLESKAVATIEATNIAENAIECFRYAERNGGSDQEIYTIFIDAFENCLRQKGDTTQVLINVTDNFYYKFKVRTQHTYFTFELKGIKKDAGEGVKTADSDAIEISAFWGNEEILKTTYTYTTPAVTPNEGTQTE